MNITIRRATAADAEDILAYLKLVGGESHNFTFGSEGLPISAEEERAFLNQMEDPSVGAFLLALDQEEIVGSGSCQIFSGPRLRHRATVALSVKKACWSKGIGSALMEKLLAELRAQSVQLITLEVLSDNHRAIRLYEKFGFTTFGTLNNYFQIDGVAYEAKYMYLKLNESCSP